MNGENFVLELFHVSDQEGKSTSVDDAPRFSAVYNFLLDQDNGEDGTLFLSSGDQWLPGLFYDASEDTSLYGLKGAADIEIQNELGVQVSAFGNHEFDNGNDPIANLLEGGDFGGALTHPGANFPYLGGNIDFSENVDVIEDGEVEERGLAPFVTENGQLASDIPGKIAEWVIVEDENGEPYGVVSVSAPSIDEGLSSPSPGTDVQPDGPDGNDNEKIAALIQEDVDALLAANPDLTKVILVAHMQQLEIEKALAELVTDVDIIIAGGSNTRLFDGDDVGYSGEQSQGDYPHFTTDAEGNPIAVVNVDQNYKYVGRLVIEFDENGYIIPGSYDQAISGAYATDQANLDRLGIDFETWADPEIVEIANGVRAVIEDGESEFYAITEEFLNGNRFGGGEGRDGVRSQETNLANLTGDANLAYAKGYDDTVVVSVKNGGGIRASVGVEVVSGLGDTERLPPEEIRNEDGNIVKPEGGISSNDVGNVLAFNNGLILLTVTAEELVQAIEGGIEDFQDVDTEAGGYLHFAGVRFSFHPDLPPGNRVINAAIVDEENDNEVLFELVRDGEIVDSGNQTFRIVTLDFLASEGNQFDGVGTDRVDLGTLDPNPIYNTVDTFVNGGEQDALAEYLNVEFGPEGEQTIIGEDTTQEFDERIQNVEVREDTVFDGGSDFDLRIATYNASLNRNEEGQLVENLNTPDDSQAQSIAEVLQRVAPDVVLLNEFDYDANGEAAALFQENYLSVSQNGQAPVEYPYVYVAPSNTGIASGFDLDNNGEIGTTPGECGYAGDAFGFGEFEGQFAFVVYSKYPIDEENIRTFQNFLWKDMPGALLPPDPEDTDGNGDTENWYTEEELEVVRLSQKNHVDLPVIVDGETVHVLAAHPTPPVFDGPEDRNGRINHDEIRLWSDYVKNEADYLYDDNGVFGGLPEGERFVIVGDYNADPFDGDSRDGAVNQFLDNPFINGSDSDPAITPDSEGGPAAAAIDGPPNDTHEGDPAFDTADFSDGEGNSGNLRVDYVLPSEAGIDIKESAVYWPVSGESGSELIDASDHRLAYTDLELTDMEPPVPEDGAKTIASIEFLGNAGFPAGFEFEGTTLGGLSSIQYVEEESVYYAISDDQADYRYYTFDIDLSDGTLDDGDVTPLEVRFFTDAEGQPLEDGSIDPEELTQIGGGTYFVTNEGFASGEKFENPSVLVFDSETDAQIGELAFSEKFDADPEGKTGIRNNAATEAGTTTPDGSTFYSGFENALLQDGPLSTPDSGSPSRIVEWDLDTGEETAEYVYQNYPNPARPDPEDAFQVNGITALLALDNEGTLLALERNFAVGNNQTGTGHGGLLYEIGTKHATNVLEEDSLEGLNYSSVDKRFLLDLSTLTDAEGNQVVIDNVEGLTFGPELEDGRQTLFIVSDDNFSDSQSTQFMAFAVELEEAEPAKPDLTFAAYNTMLSSPADPEDGGAGDLDAPGNNPDGTARDNLFNRLNGGSYEVAQNLAYVVQTERPDVMLVNEIDFDVKQIGNQTLSSAQVLNDQYFAVGQSGQSGIDYPYIYTFRSNTGVPSGFDLNNDGIVGEIDPETGLIGGFAPSEEEAVELRDDVEPRDQSPEVFLDLEDEFVKQPNDAFGFGRYEGQYSMAIYSMYPILEEDIRTFQEFLWKDMPGNKLSEVAEGVRPLYDPERPFNPEDPENPETSFFTEEEYNALRLSSKNHVDIPVDVDGRTVHILGSHPTPATYSLSPGQNESRNFDEVRFWSDYINGESYMYDDEGVSGGLEPGTPFIIAGDLNADPFDGAALPGAATQLLDDPLVNGSATDESVTPASLGGIQDDDSTPENPQLGNPAFDTVDYSLSEPGRGNVRVDYALPSTSGFEIVDSEVVWPLNEDPLTNFVDYPTSDHKMVKIGLNLTAPQFIGTPGGDTLIGTDADEVFDPRGGVDSITTGGGTDNIIFTNLTGVRDVVTVTDFNPEADTIDLSGAIVSAVTVGENETRVIFEGEDVDTFVFRGTTGAPFSPPV